MDFLPWIVAGGGGLGIAAVLKSVVELIGLLRSGVSATEGKRKVDIIRDRDQLRLDVAELEAKLEDAERDTKAALREARADRLRADWAERNAESWHHNEQRAREHAADLRNELQDHGVMRADLPTWPEMEDTIPRATLKEWIRAADAADQ